jgi:predicted DNA binding protein
LNAAYHGGYYETPRSVTGEDLADTFDISGPAVSKHLQAAHRKVLGAFLDDA